MSDLRALIVGILSGIIAYYATRGIDRYLARRTLRGHQRQVKQLTYELQLLERLGVTDRSLLLFAFRMLFPLIGLVAIGMAGWALSQPLDSPAGLLVFLVSVMIVILSLYASSVFRKLEDPDPTLAKLRQKLRELQGTDDQSPSG